jgi:diguanylate cyclase (GGDEF)-like protein/putative nucleotidyltransferase with HDIG domain
MADEVTEVTDRWLRIGLWAGLPVLLAAFVLLRYVRSETEALVLSQAIYLSAPLLAAVFTGLVANSQPPGTHARRSHTFLALSIVFLFIGEAVTAYQALVPSGGQALIVGFDVANACAIACFIAFMIGAVPSDREILRRMLRTLFDVAALVALCVAAVYELWVADVVAASGTSDSASALRYSIYAVVGMALLAANILVFLGSRRSAHVGDSLLTIGISVFGAGVVLWPLWMAGIETPDPQIATVVPVLLYFVGYYLVFVAAVLRLRDPEPRRSRSHRIEQNVGEWVGIVMSTTVLVSVATLGVAAFMAEPGSPQQVVFLATLSVATVALVLRTMVDSADLDAVSVEAHVDPITGLDDVSALATELASAVSHAQMTQRSVGVLVADVDGFARINAEVGFVRGDRALREIAAVIRSIIGSTGRVFRLSGDEFAVIVENADRLVAERIARALVVTARRIQVGNRALTLSVGYALYPLDASNSVELFERADRAQAWAKMRGKDRAVGFDPTLTSLPSSLQRSSGAERTARSDMVRALAAAADARDPSNSYHSRNVAALARLLAVSLGFEPEHVEKIEIAALLHDVGKIALPDVAVGATPLSARDRRRAREHSELGAQLVGPLGLEGLGDWVRAHHERWDGTGFPTGLAGAQIPLEARIIALADAYDGMITGKRYGAPMSKGAALQEIDHGMGVRFDPDLAERFIEVVARIESLGWSDEWRVTA